MPKNPSNVLKSSSSSSSYVTQELCSADENIKNVMKHYEEQERVLAKLGIPSYSECHQFGDALLPGPQHIQLDAPWDFLWIWRVTCHPNTTQASTIAKRNYPWIIRLINHATLEIDQLFLFASLSDDESKKQAVHNIVRAKLVELHQSLDGSQQRPDLLNLCLQSATVTFEDVHIILDSKLSETAEQEEKVSIKEAEEEMDTNGKTSFCRCM